MNSTNTISLDSFQETILELFNKSVDLKQSQFDSLLERFPFIDKCLEFDSIDQFQYELPEERKYIYFGILFLQCIDLLEEEANYEFLMECAQDCLNYSSSVIEKEIESSRVFELESVINNYFNA